MENSRKSDEKQNSYYNLDFGKILGQRDFNKSK